MKFEWDEQKAEFNKRKHDLSFQEATTCFGDAFALSFSDPDHSELEDRYITFGRTVTGKHVIISHTDRNDVIRIISARPMTSAERRTYEHG